MPYPQRPPAQAPIANAYRKCPVCRDTCPAKVQIIHQKPTDYTESHKKEIASKAFLFERKPLETTPVRKEFVLSLF